MFCSDPTIGEKSLKCFGLPVNGTADPNPNLRHRKSSKSHQNGISEVKNTISKKLVFKFNSGDSIQSDFR